MFFYRFACLWLWPRFRMVQDGSGSPAQYYSCFTQVSDGTDLARIREIAFELNVLGAQGSCVETHYICASRALELSTSPTLIRRLWQIVWHFGTGSNHGYGWYPAYKTSWATHRKAIGCSAHADVEQFDVHFRNGFAANPGSPFKSLVNTILLVGGFKYFLFSPLLGEDFQFD